MGRLWEDFYDPPVQHVRTNGQNCSNSIGYETWILRLGQKVEADLDIQVRLR